MEKIIDDPKINDNRSYDYTYCTEQKRDEYHLIVEMIESGSKVIDLGCGNGSLLKMLKDCKQIEECGIELVQSGVEACQKKGLKACQGKIDVILTDIEDKSFDYAICNVTIQMVMYPEVLLGEMKRIAKYQIFSFPNFGHWRNRLDLLLRGRMPRPMLFGYQWYNTGHIHQLSIKDFENVILRYRLKVLDKIFFRDRVSSTFNLNPNLFATIAIYLLSDQ